MMKTLLPFLLVAIGGAIGSVTRYSVGLAATRRFGPAFPFGTLIVNIVGCFLIGLVMAIVIQKALPFSDEIRLGIAVGFLGGLTTFSSFTFETDSLARNGEWLLSLANLVGTIVAGFVALRLGAMLIGRG